jgi:dihydrofolate reductase
LQKRNQLWSKKTEVAKLWFVLIGRLAHSSVSISPPPLPSMVWKRKIIVYITTSADGFIARPDGSVDWLERPRPKGGYGFGEFYKSIDTTLWGRKTCDMAIDFQKKGVPGADFDTRVKNYVFTHNPPQSAPKGVEFLYEPIKSFAANLRVKKGKTIWIMGGAGIIASFLDEGEIDEFIINVIPTFIGEGIPLIAPRHRTVPLTLLSCKKFEDGVVKLHYSVRK